ncbi:MULTISPECIES: energy transducer TonB [unclassified Treponema]|uniref:energy transducer TonB n=1 Tax=unclassified Treponema TaxID=2638727 RepID=UPI0020A37B10|nr:MULTISPECIES: TonB family protein [unclassified Treponema]UTC66176.1 energy transducer TonB [Treponema sp. OMZ 789]UTC68905.1 energy transducer TonB [Treponema sp. OMZ 790]UTC71633.1 energy transducer TonB [Treponema sp. OMZ 791]
MTRWISSAVCTIILVAVLFCLPVWNIRSSAAISSISDSAIQTMSEVHIVRRIPKKVSPAVQKQNIQPKTAPIIPAPPTEPVPETPEEPEETPDDASEANESNASDASSVPGDEDSFSRAQDPKAVATYKSYALGRIASKKTYPYRARSNGFEGKVRVRIVINPDGKLAQADILEPSKYEILNNACLTSIKKASPFKKMTDGMSAMTLTFIMDFSLK